MPAESHVFLQSAFRALEQLAVIRKHPKGAGLRLQGDYLFRQGA